MFRLGARKNIRAWKIWTKKRCKFELGKRKLNVSELKEDNYGNNDCKPPPHRQKKKLKVELLKIDI